MADPKITNPCKTLIITPPEEPKPPCPTCIPDKNYKEPTWYLTEEPYLNKKTCEYMITMTVNSRGDAHSPDTIKKSGLSFKKLLKTYIRPGVRLMLRHFNKLETDQVVCASYTEDTKDQGVLDTECREIIDVDYSEFMKERNKAADLQGTSVYKFYDVEETIKRRFPQIKNINALELYAKAPDYHFTGYNGSIMKVLVTIPAFIFDQVDDAPPTPDVDTSVERLFISPRRLKTDIIQLKETFKAFGQYQAFFYKFQNGNLFHKDTGERFYIKFYTKRLELFENALEKLLKNNGYTYENVFNIRTPNMPDKIKFVFDKSDPKKPFTLKRVGAKTKGCPYKRLRKGQRAFLRKVNEDQTLLGFIANLKDIRNDLNARETIGWFDFLLKYVYPNLGVNYGTKDKYKETTAVNCLADKLGLSGIDDFVHDAVGRFSELFSYTISKNACRHLTSSNPQPPVFKSDGGLHEKYIDEWAKNKFSKIGEKSDLEVMLEDIKDNYDRINDSDDKLKRVLASLNPCAMNELLFSGIRCLMSGLSFNESMRILVKKALSTMAGEALEKVIEGLPYDKQEAIRKKVESEFKGMPMPWDVNYKPGSLDKVIDKQANDEVAKNEKLYSDSVAEKSSIEQKMKETKARIEEFDYCLANERDCTKEGRKREQTPTPEVEPLAPLLNFSKILQRGSKGEEVRATQLALRALDYPITADGDFGRKTRDAVKSFQKAANITSDGIVGAGTRAAINQRLSANTAGATPKPSENLFSELLADEMQKETNLSKELMKASKNFDSKKQEVADLEAVISGNREKIEILKIERINVLGQISALQQKILRDAQFLGAGYDDPAELFQRNSTLQALEQRIQLIDLDITQYENSIVVGEEEYLPAAKLEASKAKKQFEDAQFELDSYNELSSGRLIEGFDSSDIIENEIALLKADWFVKKTDLETKLKELEKKSSSNEETLEDLSAYALWKTATPDQKALLTQMEREKFDRAIVQSVSPDDADLIEQGSFGTALGNVQQAIFQAYVEAIMETAELNELITVIDKVPGIKLIGNLLAGLKSCVFKNFIYPPISSFLNTLTFDPCGPGKTRLMLPELQDLPNFNGWNFLSLVKAAFLGALKQVATEILFAILFKLASIVFDITCKTLAAAGRAAVRGVLGDTGWRNAVDDIFCGDEKSEEERERLPELVLTTAAPQLKNVPDSSTRDLAETLSVIGTKSEYIRAITSSPDDQDQNFMKNLATFVAAKHPEFAPLIGTAEGMTNMFGQVSNLLTAEQIAALRDGLDDVADVPLEQSICLTDEELDQWNNDRANALEEAGLDPAIARDFVDRQNDRRKSDLADLAEILAKGPENIIGDAINEAINTDPADPECAVVKQVANLEKLDQVKKFMNKAQDGMFKRLESAFLDDIILWRWPIDPRGWLDSPGILSTILGDKEGYTLNFHYIARNNIFFKIMRFTTFLQYPKHEEFPETVGITFKEALDNITIDTTGQKTKIQIEYDITPEWHWKSNTVLTNNFKERNSNGEMVNTRSFDYKFRQRSRENFVGNFVVERIQSDRLNKWMRSNKLTATESELRQNTYRNILFKKYLKEIFKGFRSIGISHSDANKVLKGLENLCNNKLMSSLLQQDGEMAHGFLHGSKNQEIRAEHLEYVGPKGEEYDYDEDEAVFGKAKVSNSRVKFLDPAEYGGSYTSPNIYISPPKDEGLMSISRVFLPDLKSGCNPKISKTHFLFFEDIKERIDKARQSIPTHKKLSFAPDCVKEIPFDKIASPATLASLEGVVIATIRVYLAQFFIKTMPVWSNIDLGSDDGINLRNFDELLSEYVVSLMRRGLINEKSIFARATYEGYPYWLLFLEQAAQIAKRRVKDGTFKENEDLRESFQKINALQEEHIVPSVDNMVNLAKRYDGEITESDLEDDYLAESIVKGGALIGGIMERGDLPSNFAGSFGTVAWSAFNLNQAKFAAKMWTIHRGQKEAINLLKYLVAEQISFYRKEITKKMSQLGIQPYHYDVKKTMIGAQGIALGKAVQSGIYEIESPEAPAVKRDYGDVNDVTSDPLSKHTLSGGEISEKDFNNLKKNGGIYIEKYVRIFDRAPLVNGRVIEKPSFIIDRPISLQGVVNIQEFKKFLSDNVESIPEDMKISDVFLYQKEGDPEKGTQTQESPGIMFGVRVCYIPPEGFNPFGDEIPQGADRKVRREKSFINAPINFKVSISDIVSNVANKATDAAASAADAASEAAKKGGSLGEIGASAFTAASGVLSSVTTTITTQEKTLENSRYSFPLINYEVPLDDRPLRDLIDTDNNLNEDLKCYIDRLTEIEEFDFIFDKCVNIRRVGSILMTTTYDSWVASIGAQGSGERNEIEVAEAYEDLEEDYPAYRDSRSSDFFNDSRKECRKLFISNYKRNDFDPEDEEEDFDFVKDNLNQMLDSTYSAVLYNSDVPFWMKWRVLKDNPDDENGKPCGNQFTKLFKKG